MNRPQTYNKNNVLQKHDNKFILEKYLKLVSWKRNPKVLDVGFGDGKTTLEILEPRLPEDYIKLSGCDLQKNMVEYANKHNKNSKMDYFQLDIATDKKLTAEYDHIFSFFAFMWIKELRIGFQNIFDLLNPEGDMLVSMVSECKNFGAFKALAENPIWAPYFSHVIIPTHYKDSYGTQKLKIILEEIGFQNVQIFIEYRHFYFDNWAHLLKFFWAVDPIISKLDEEQRVEYMVDFFIQFKNALGDYEEENGKINLPYTLFVIYGSKPK